MLNNLLLYRFAIFNLLMLVLLGYVWAEDHLGFLFDGERTGLVVAIACLFLATWAATARQVYRVSIGLNVTKSQRWSSDTPQEIEGERDKAREKVRWLADASNWLVGLGLIGTVIGFAIALGGIDSDSLGSASGVQTAVEELMAGMKIALNTTIAGAILGTWNEVNQRMLRTAMECYWADRLAQAR